MSDTGGAERRRSVPSVRSTRSLGGGGRSAQNGVDIEERRAVVRSFVPTLAGMVGFFVAAVTTHLDGVPVALLVLTVSALAVAVAARVGDRPAGLGASVMAACSFDFFHVHPLRSLHPASLITVLTGFGLLAASQPRRSRDID